MQVNNKQNDSMVPTIIEGTTYKAERDAIQHLRRLLEPPYLCVFQLRLAGNCCDPKSDTHRVQDGATIVCLYMTHSSTSATVTVVLLTRTSSYACISQFDDQIKSVKCHSKMLQCPAASKAKPNYHLTIILLLTGS